MSTEYFPPTGRPAIDYAELTDAARALIDGESDRVANAANLSALVYQALPQVN